MFTSIISLIPEYEFYSKFLEKSTKMSQNILYYRKALQVGLHISKDFVIFP